MYILDTMYESVCVSVCYYTERVRVLHVRELRMAGYERNR